MGDPRPQPVVRALEWAGDAATGSLRLLDQTLLPQREVWLSRTHDDDVVADIRRLAVRGAPAIGLAGAFGLVLAARALETQEPVEFAQGLAGRAERLASARPTAVNLAGAVEAALRASGAFSRPPAEVPHALLAVAREMARQDAEACTRIAEAGARWLGARRRFITHCNAGALVTAGLGTALAPIYWMKARGDDVFVWVDETRPLLQGLRLTAWELGRAGIGHRVLGDGAAAALLRRGEVDAVLVGADRVCRNGDVVNKVGTYALALAAERHGVPLLVAAPSTTLDPGTPSGEDVEIEQRPDDLDRYLLPGTVPVGVERWAPAFDVTPADLVGALVTERGVVERPSEASLRAWMEAATEVQPRQGGGR